MAITQFSTAFANRYVTLRARSAREYLAADTIFIEDVIFRIFFTLFSRVSISLRVAIPLAALGARVTVDRSIGNAMAYDRR